MSHLIKIYAVCKFSNFCLWLNTVFFLSSNLSVFVLTTVVASLLSASFVLSLYHCLVLSLILSIHVYCNRPKFWDL